MDSTDIQRIAKAVAKRNRRAQRRLKEQQISLSQGVQGVSDLDPLQDMLERAYQTSQSSKELDTLENEGGSLGQTSIE